MKFWRNPAALLTVFHPETTHSGNHSTPKDVKNEGRPGYVAENKGTMDKMSEIMSDICARLKPFLQKIGVSSSQNTCKVPRTYRTAGGAPSDGVVISGSKSLKPKSAPPPRQGPPPLNRGGELSLMAETQRSQRSS